MASPTASICETYRHSEQKQSQKFCGSKEGKNSETHPKSSEKGETGCVLGAGEGSSGWRRMKPGEKTRKARRKSRDGLVSAAASVGPGRSPPGCRPPRHALRRAQPCLVAKSYRTLTKKSGTAEAIPDFFGRGRRTRTLGTRFWSGCGKAHWGNGGGAVLPGFQRKSGGGRCWFGAMGNFPGQNGRKRAGNPRKNVKYY